MNKILFYILFVATSLFSLTFEHNTLYKETKVMGMGGAAVASKGGVHSLFYNTAGLDDISKEDGWEVEILNIGVAYGDKAQDFFKEFQDANDIEDDNKQTIAILDLVESYLNKNLHISVSAAVAKVAKRHKDYVYAFMPIAGVNLNIKTHRGSGAAGLIEANGIYYKGLVFGASKELGFKKFGGYTIENIAVGVGVKYIQHKTIKANLSLADLLDDDLSDNFMDDYTKDSSDFVLDLGVKATVYKDVTAGIAVQNMGDIAQDSKTNIIPTTLNIGVAYKKNIDRIWLNSYEVAFDYTDILYQYSQDDDFIKRTRLGISGDVVGGRFGTVSLQTGFHQGYNTMGFAIDSEVFKLSYAYYTSEVGAVAFQDGDKRHSLQFSIGW